MAYQSLECPKEGDTNDLSVIIPRYVTFNLRDWSKIVD